MNPQGFRFNTYHKKQMSIWNKLHQQIVEEGDLLSQYDSISTDNKIIEALKIGLEDAQGILQGLGMQPKRHTEYSWWFKPWIEDHNVPTFEEVDEVVDNSPPGHSTSIFQSLSFMVLNDSELQTMESEWRHELDGILDSIDENVNISTKPVVELDGKDMYKSCLVSQLNGNPTLSKDRLTKVRNGVYFRRDERAPKKGVAIGFGIGSYYVVLFERNSITIVERTKRKSVSQSTKHDVSSGTWYIGRVQRIRKKDSNRVFDYHNDINLLDRPEGVKLQCCWYNRIKGQRMYKYDSTDHLFIQLESVIATANLCFPNVLDYSPICWLGL